MINQGGKYRLVSPARPIRDDAVLPMINVVFLLLVFFMLAGQLTNQQTIVIDPLESDSDLDVDTTTQVLTLDQYGTIYLNGVEVSLADLPQTQGLLVGAVAESQLHIRADQRVEAFRVVELLDVLREMQIHRVRLLTVSR